MVTRTSFVGRISRIVFGCLCWIGAASGVWFWLIFATFILAHYKGWYEFPAWLGPLDAIGFFKWRLACVFVLIGIPVAITGLALLGKARRRLDWIGASLSVLATASLPLGLWVAAEILLGGGK